MSDHAETIQAEAREIVEWLFAQVKVYRRHAPAITEDIKRFEDAAALIDSFRAGLTVVPPHPALRMELIRWTRTSERMPDDGKLVLLICVGDDSPWMGYRNGLNWYGADGMPFRLDTETYWAEIPTGPAAITSPAMFEEAAA